MKSNVTWGSLLMVAGILFLLFLLWVEFGGRHGKPADTPTTIPAIRTEQ